MMLMNIKLMMIAGGIVVAMLVVEELRISSLKGEVGAWKKDYEVLQKELLVEKLNRETCLNMLGKQNAAKVKVDNELAVKKAELEAWKNKPAEVKYKTVYKYIKDKNATCEDMVESVRSIDLNRL